MSRPTTTPEWASDTNYPAGTDAWSATATKTEPTSGEKGTGATPLTGFGAQQLNWLIGELSKWAVHIDNAATGSGFLVRDDFTGSALDTGKWTSTLAGGGSQAMVDDDTNGGSGALDQIVSAAGGTSKIEGRKCPIGTADYRLCARVRNVSGLITSYKVGVRSATQAEEAYFQPQGSNWWWVVGASSGDTGVAVGTSYKNLEVVRRSELGTVQFYIDGTSVHSEANVVNIAAAFPSAANVIGSATAGTFRVDALSFWFDR